MSHEKEIKAVSPLLQQAIHISSIVGGVGTVIFCIWAYQAGIFALQGNPICLYPTGGYLGATTLYLFTDFADSCSYHSRSSNLRCRCLYLWSHHRDHLQLYRYCHWLCHHLLLGASLRSTLCPVHGQQTHL